MSRSLFWAIMVLSFACIANGVSIIFIQLKFYNIEKRIQQLQESINADSN